MNDRCGERTGGAPSTMRDCGYDWLDAVVVEQIRWLCVGYGRNDPTGWETALIRAEEIAGTESGPALFAAVSAVLVTMRRGRRSRFQYTDPSCPACSLNVVASERALMRVIRAARRGEYEAMDAHALLLLEGQDTTAINRAARRLAAVTARIDAEQNAINRSWQRPAPRPLAGQSRNDACEHQHNRWSDEPFTGAPKQPPSRLRH